MFSDFTISPTMSLHLFLDPIWCPKLHFPVNPSWSFLVHFSVLLSSWPDTWPWRSRDQLFYGMFLTGFFWYFLMVGMKLCIFDTNRMEMMWSSSSASCEGVRDVYVLLPVLFTWTTWLSWWLSSLCCKIPVSLLWLPWGEMLKVCKCSFASNIHPPIFASLMDLICNGYYCNICLVVILLVPLYLGLLEFYCKEDLFLPHIYFLVF